MTEDSHRCAVALLRTSSCCRPGFYELRVYVCCIATQFNNQLDDKACAAIAGGALCTSCIYHVGLLKVGMLVRAWALDRGWRE
jgi:hypothetical protein